MDTLVINADGSPVSVMPLSTILWQESIKYLVLDKVNVLEWHENWIVRSANWETRVPSVVMLKEYMKTKKNVRFSKSNVFLRDLYTCQYCRADLTKAACTLDHVTPISLGGKTTWDNSVTACGPCNSRKSNSTKIKPFIRPYRPDFYELVNKRKQLPFNLKHNAWKEYIT
jgi:5-methylcytosine-specific restriction endonuclease McrA